ncbi:MAG: Asp-tRNA(Asn)/Glu-tRNA(Gln) amidotransferase subunit GatC [Patescibacteria group bacterium]
MSLSITDIEYAATLARISLTEEEKSLYLGQFATILTYFDVLSELDVASVEPIYQVTGQENVYREDEVVNASRQKDMVANAPVSDKGSIQVPSVM